MKAIITYAELNLKVKYTMLDLELGEIEIHSIKDKSNDDLYDTFEESNELDTIIELVLEYDPYQ